MAREGMGDNNYNKRLKCSGHGPHLDEIWPQAYNKILFCVLTVHTINLMQNTLISIGNDFSGLFNS